MNATRSISNSPPPVLENEVVGTGSSRTTRAEQQQPARISEPMPEEERNRVMSSFPGLQLRDRNPVSTDQASSGIRHDVLPGTLARPQRSPSDGQETTGQTEKPRSKYETLPNEVQQKILSLLVPRGSRADKLPTLNHLANVSKNFEAQVKAGPLQKLNSLADLRTERGYRRRQGESDLRYASRLMQKKPSLTREEAVFVATNGSDQDLEHDVTTVLELQPTKVQNMIALLKDQILKDEGKDKFDYAIRLKQNRPDLTPEHASMAVFGYAPRMAVKFLSERLEFQLPEVQAEVTDIRTQHPMDDNLDLNAEHYGVRLMEDYHVPAVLAALAARGTSETSGILRLAEMKQRMRSLG